ncbi:MAG: alanine--glyoxylate aminotransferase family protein [Candidatus Promineifilaceae bacterium]
MIGHRSPECAELIASIQNKIRQVFYTDKRVFICASSGTGLQEAAIRNCSDTKVLNCVNGAFADRWHRVTLANDKNCELLEVDWGQPILPEQVTQRIRGGGFDAVTIVHNETSTGVTSPIREIAQAIREMPGGEDIMILVDSVSGLGGARIEVDVWDMDVVITSSQKAFALPPGLAFCSVSDRAMDKARSVAGRGYYFDFLELDKYLLRNQTPNTPPVSLLFALDRQLTDMLAEGMEQRFARHLAMRDKTIEWASGRGFNMFAALGYESPTVSCIRSKPTIDVSELIANLRSRKMIISDGYGPNKGKSFRIAHMGDTTPSDLDELLEVIDAHISGLI